MIYLKRGNQPLDSKLAIIAGSISSKITARSAQILHLQFKVSKASLLLSFLNTSLLEGDLEEVEGVLWALVFLGMVLG